MTSKRFLITLLFGILCSTNVFTMEANQSLELSKKEKLLNKRKLYKLRRKERKRLGITTQRNDDNKCLKCLCGSTCCLLSVPILIWLLNHEEILKFKMD